MLRHLCFDVRQSRGRRYPEPDHPYRNLFQRDRDRIVHARAFRRLEAKTQVFTPGLSDHFRNRLTHTIEVAQISRTVAGALGLNEDLTEALALAHDIGHPPFSHAGERELNVLMSRFGERFDHNLHALRIVEHFEQRYALFPGLNLSFEVREGIVKHSRDLVPGELAELDEYLPALRPPLEAQLIDLADEIAYDSADLDDAYSAHMFYLDEVAAEVPRYGEIREIVETQFPGASDKERFYESLRELIDGLVSAMIEATALAAKDAGVQTVQDVRNWPKRLASLTPEAHLTARQLKRFLYSRVYSSPVIDGDRQRSAARISTLFEFFVDHPDRLPDGYREQAADQPPHRVVCDYIAGMTDAYFERTFEQIFTPQPA
jgi:dGTPase